MIRLRDIEREYDPYLGSLGRGILVTRELADSIDSTGYRPFVTSGGHDIIVYDSEGRPTSLVWRGFVREEDGKHFVAAIEFDKMRPAE